MLTTPIIAALLALAPPAEAPREFDARLDSAEFVAAGDGDGAEIIGYDASGEAIGVIVVWVDSRGRLHVDSEYDDGYAAIVFEDGEATVDSALPASVVSTRAGLLGARLDHAGPDAQAGWGGCAFSVVGTVLACASANPWCPLTAIPLTCNCAPVLINEWEDERCPGF